MGIAIAIVARTTEVGSRTLVDAVKPEIEANTHGAFLMDCKIFPYVQLMVEDDGCQKLTIKQQW